jgi:hypothetical protein
MITVSIQIPDSVKRHVERLAAKEGISVDQFYATAAAEKLAALEAADYIAQRAARSDREAFLRVLAKVPPAEPEEWDRQ